MSVSTDQCTTTQPALQPNNVVTLSPLPANLLTALVDYHIDLICQPATDALSATRLADVRTRVGRLVQAGRLVAARNLVAAEIEVCAVAAEATRHMHDGSCRLCPDLWQHCDALEALEAREDSLHRQIAALGGF